MFGGSHKKPPHPCDGQGALQVTMDCCVKFCFGWLLGWFGKCVSVSLFMLLNVLSHGLTIFLFLFLFQFILDQPATLDISSCFNVSNA